MPYDENLASKIRKYLNEHEQHEHLKVEEKILFSGLSFMINDKMCINVSGESLMCRFDPSIHEEVAERNGFETMVMRGKELKGYCFVNPTCFSSPSDFRYWMDLCLSFNDRAKSSKKPKK